MNINKLRILFVAGVLPLLVMSCVNSRKVVLFNELNQASIKGQVEDFEPIIQKNDLLSITVSSLNTEAAAIFNNPNISGTQTTTATGNQASVAGYLVNSDGYVQFPVLGNIKAAGLSKKQLKDNITKGLIDGKLLLDPIVNIRYLNYKVTVIGEVGHPTVINVPNEKISLLEALGLAGDLTVYSRRDNVLVIREIEGTKTFQRLNLNTNEIFTSPYYYLKSNDIVYVETNKNKVASTSRAVVWIPVIFSALSTIVTVAWIINNNANK
ncbi:MAG: polysaccharide biosynthesis/export family protein [Bacteroidetes bacterium]|nr:polysaccharide biosynthesis/export family protein [Bacteroidota bacterium]MBS1609163.1 polysaccharide biosynthesis/export family protein [Bacteroidota bacterium]